MSGVDFEFHQIENVILKKSLFWFYHLERHLLKICSAHFAHFIFVNPPLSVSPWIDLLDPLVGRCPGIPTTNCYGRFRLTLCP